MSYPRNLILSLVAGLALVFAWPMNRADAASGDMTVTEGCFFNSCYLVLNGIITADTPGRLRTAAAKLNGNLIILESSGGSLTAALEMGRFIREKDYHTRIGSLDRGELANTCFSACAYVFLGGASREIEEQGKIGFHRFSMAPGRDQLVSASSALNAAQNLSSSLVNYVIEMGVDARIFTDASKTPSDEMLIPNRTTLLDYEIITPGSFSPFKLDPNGKGVMAISRRLHKASKFQNLGQLTAYCANGRPGLFYATDVTALAGWDPAPLTVTLSGAISHTETIPASQVSLKGNKVGSYVDVRISKKLAERIASASKLETAFDFPNAAGGIYEFHGDLDNDARKYLEAAFRLCVR